MKINNPRSMVDFTRGSTADEIAYNLATIGQLKTAVDNITTKFTNFLAGSKLAGSGGMANNFGYAWLNSEGKVDPRLLPPLSITDVHVVKQAELLNVVEDSTGVAVETLLNVYIQKIKAEQNIVFQRGDIIIVQPTKGDTPEHDEVPHPAYSGSYIITAVPGDIIGKNNETTVDYLISKIAYTDSNIVKINGKAPSTTAGELTLFLKDILQERYYEAFDSINNGVVSADVAAQALENTVYNLVTIVEGEGLSVSNRFGFMDTDKHIVPYAKLQELTDLRTQEETHFADLTAAIDDLDTRTFNTFADVRNEILTTSGLLSSTLTAKTDYISGVIGDDTQVANRELSASIFAQVKALRNNVDDNLTLLNNTRRDTNEHLTMIQQNVKDLRTKLNEKAVTIVEKEIEWTTANAEVAQLIDFTTLASLSGEPVTDFTYRRTSSDVKGIIKWHLKYEPTTEGPENSARSEERILAIYDHEGNEILADMVRNRKLNNNLMATDIYIDTEYYGKNANNEYINSMIGTKWTLMIAKTIVNIPLADATFLVGGNLPEPTE